MDLTLWDPPDDQTSSDTNYRAGNVKQCGHYNVGEQNSSYHNEDNLLCDFCLGYGRDMIEEDALNEKCCLQVLKILKGKADGDISKLKEEIVAWGDESWSKPCSAALSEKIDRLDVLLQNSKMEIMHHPDVQPEQAVEPPRLHDRLKQTKDSISKMPVLPTSGFSKEKSEVSTSKIKKKLEDKECATIMLETNEMKSPSMELDESKTSNPTVSPSTSIEKANSRETKESRNNDNEVTFKANINGHGLEQESRVTNLHLKSQERETQFPELVEVNFVKPPNAMVYRHTINKNVLSTKPSVQMKRTMTKIPEIKYSIGASIDGTKHATQPEIKIEPDVIHEVQVKIPSSSEPEGQSSFVKEEDIDVASSATKNSKGQQMTARKKTRGSDGVTKPTNTASNSTTKEGRDGVKDVGRLKVADLRAIAKSRGLRHYYNLKKAELQKRLGLEQWQFKEEACEQKGPSEVMT